MELSVSGSTYGLTQSIPKPPYLIPVVSKALDILEVLRNESRSLPLGAIHRRTSIPKTTVFRILKTLVHRGYVSRSQGGLYHLVGPPNSKLQVGRPVRT
jgi:ribose transport system substrate-binding protein